MNMELDELARSVNALRTVDVSPFQRRARILQAIWREEQGLGCGTHRGELLGSRLVMPDAQQSLANYLTERTRDTVWAEVNDPAQSSGKLYGKPRIFNDLLSSQPMCFNLFAELRFDLALASSVVQEMTGGRFTEVSAVKFEYSPGRRDPRFTEDNSAFDVFLQCTTRSRGAGFIGIEVKYHENLRDPASSHKSRYEQIAAQMGCFIPEAAPRLQKAPLQQIWRDHLLVGSLQRHTKDCDDALFVVLHPQDNKHVHDAVAGYRACLSDASSFDSWTLEKFVGTMKKHSDAGWIDAFSNRYLAFGKIDARLRGQA
jgi:hypothetical protein